MSTKKLSKPMQVLFKKYWKYLDGSFEINYYPPFHRTKKEERELMLNEMKRELAGKIKVLASHEDSKDFTFPDWYYVCYFFPREVEYCKRLLGTAVAPHEKMFALLLTLNNWSDHNNSNHKEYMTILGKDNLFDEVTPASWYDTIPKTTHREFSLLWSLIAHFPLGKRIMNDNGPWVWDFWEEKCSSPSKIPYV